MNMAQLIYLKERITYFYGKHEDRVRPFLKFLFSFFALCMLQNMFHYNARLDNRLILLAVSAAQAFLPLSFLYYTSSILIALNLWKVSLDIFLGIVALFVICWLVFVRVERKYAVIVALTAILFFMRLEYVLPVLLGMSVGIGSILPAVAGILLYFLSVYMADVSTLITTSSSSNFGMGIQRIMNLLLIDKKLLVLLVTFMIVIFVTALLTQLFYERAWLFSVLVGNLAMALILLSGKLIFELDYGIGRIFLEVILGIGLCFVFRFFRGIGDTSRIERISFEDDEYFYYVKAVPKMKVTEKEGNVTTIVNAESEDVSEEDEEAEDADFDAMFADGAETDTKESAD